MPGHRRIKQAERARVPGHRRIKQAERARVPRHRRIKQAERARVPGHRRIKQAEQLLLAEHLLSKNLRRWQVPANPGHRIPQMALLLMPLLQERSPQARLPPRPMHLLLLGCRMC